MTAADLLRIIAQVRQSAEFDARWYARTYPDVPASGLDPASHYVLIGDPLGRDPGPEFSTRLWRELSPGDSAKPGPALIHYLEAKKRDRNLVAPRVGNVLFLAGQRARGGDPDGALALAERHLPAGLIHTIVALRANVALDHQDEAGWLSCLNAYLERFCLAPIRLNGTGSLLRRLSTRALPDVAEGPLVSVIMPAWNAAETVEAAVRSILQQTWRPLELIAINDASTDETGAILQRLAQEDGRLRVLHNPVNAGPYVAKNVALSHARGAWITGHDADDWAHPQRIARHLAAVNARDVRPLASMTQLIRISPDGRFSFLDKTGVASPDGVSRRAPISLLFETDFLRTRLGHWDSLRFGADSEMVGRAMTVLGSDFAVFDQPSMLCFDIPTSLSNDPRHGVDKTTGMSPARQVYRDAWRSWHAGFGPGADAYLPLLQTERRFFAPAVMRVPIAPETLALVSDADE